MVVHSDSQLGFFIGFAVVAGAFAALIPAVGFLLSGNSRTAAKITLGAVGTVLAYVVTVIAVSLLSPQTIVNIGDSYCADIWCIGIDRVSPEHRGAETVYRVDVHIFSDANRVKTSAQGYSLYVFDEKGRRFPLIKDPSAVPFDSVLDPRQSMNTTLTFRAAADSQHLFLWGESSTPPPFWLKLYLGSDTGLFHRPTLLRVL